MDKTIAVFQGFSHSGYESGIISHLMYLAEQNGYRILAVPFGSLSHNSIYNPASDSFLQDKEFIDGIVGFIALGGPLGTGLDEDRWLSLLQPYIHRPIVTIERPLPGHPVVKIDNASGMEQLMDHLIVHHGYSRFCFLKGFEFNRDMDERLTVFRRSLEKYGLKDNGSVELQGDVYDGFRNKADEKAFLKLVPDLDAVITVTDLTAARIKNILEWNGFSVPFDIAVTGFDNTELFRVFPPITTVSQPLRELASKSFTVLMNRLKGRSCDTEYLVPTAFVRKGTCGCLEFESDRLLSENTIIPEDRAVNHLNQEELQEFARNHLPTHIQYDQLTDLLKKSLSEQNPELFLRELDRALEWNLKEQLPVIMWETLLSGILQMETEGDMQGFSRLIRNRLSAAYQLEPKASFLENSNYIYLIFNVLESLSQSDGLEDAMEKFFGMYPRFGLNSGLAVLFDENEPIRKGRLLGGFSQGQLFPFDGKPFPVKELIPETIRHFFKGRHLLLLGFYDPEDRKHYGYVLFEMEKQFFSVYSALYHILNNAINTANLIREVNEYAKTLEQKVADRTEELKEANRRLVDYDQSRNEFITNVTHDFRSPLSAILGTAKLGIDTDGRFPEDKKMAFSVIYEASARLRRTIDRLLDLSRLDAGKMPLNPQPLNPQLFLRGKTAYYTSQLFSTGIKVSYAGESEPVPAILADAEAFEDIFDNVVSNAVKFVNPESGKILFRVRKSIRTGFLCIEVEDNGIGIHKNDLQTVFERFKQVSLSGQNKNKGSGIGLAYSRKLAESMGGQLWAESEGKGQGARFVMEFPVADDFGIVSDSVPVLNRLSHDARNLALGNELQSVTTDSRFDISISERDFLSDSRQAVFLMIDKDFLVLQTLRNVLESKGFCNFILAADGDEGLKAAEEYRPDLIICDYYAARTDGSGVFEALQEKTSLRHIPFLFLSAYSDKETSYQCRENGAVSFLHKPIDIKEFSLEVEKALQNYRNLLKAGGSSPLKLQGILGDSSFRNHFTRDLAARRNRDYALILFDVRDFSALSRSYGDKTANGILLRIGEILKESLRENDRISFAFPDRFTVLLPDSDEYTGRKVAGRISGRIQNEEFFSQTGESFRIHLYFGSMSLYQHEETLCGQLDVHELTALLEPKPAENPDWEAIKKKRQELVSVSLSLLEASLEKSKNQS